jgi:hypothetical protein
MSIQEYGMLRYALSSVLGSRPQSARESSCSWRNIVQSNQIYVFMLRKYSVNNTASYAFNSKPREENQAGETWQENVLLERSHFR